MRIGVPQESAEAERRDALVPEVVKKLVGKGHEVVVAAGAGETAVVPDALYVDAGAVIGDPWGRARGEGVAAGAGSVVGGPEADRVLESAGQSGGAFGGRGGGGDGVCDGGGPADLAGAVDARVELGVRRRDARGLAAPLDDACGCGW